MAALRQEYEPYLQALGDYLRSRGLNVGVPQRIELVPLGDGEDRLLSGADPRIDRAVDDVEPRRRRRHRAARHPVQPGRPRRRHLRGEQVMDAFTTHTGIGVPLRRSNVDTDQIIPAVYLKRVTRTGFEDGLFAAWRNDPDFELNRPQFAGASKLHRSFAAKNAAQDDRGVVYG